jgi:glycerophosphoryl diester phosphodiesterase
LEGELDVWDATWAFLKTNHIIDMFFVVLMITVTIFILFNFRRIKSIGKNGVELYDNEGKKINPNDSCPYAESKKRSMEKIDANAKQIAENTKSIEILTKMLKEIVLKVDDFRLDQLKVIFWTINLPIEERLIAGLKYIAAGGNHDTKTETIKLAKENLSLYKMIIKLKPELKLKEIE